MRFGCRDNRTRLGILIAQLGTPEAPTAKALRPYLKQFLSDRRVIELNPFYWWFILNGIVLRTRPRKSAKAYGRIWTDQGSPLLLTTTSQANKLKSRLENSVDLEVVVAMRYGNPSINQALKELTDKKCNRIVVVPMYPQYAAATTASVYDDLFAELVKYRYVPTLRIVEPFYRHPLYIKAVAEKVRDYDQKTKQATQKFMFSYHGIPFRYAANGDPYCCQCVATTTLLRKELNMPTDRLLHTYQSRFGKEPWLTPYTDETVSELAKQGIKRIAVACPGFVADCLETLDEIGNELSEQFHEEGGERLELIPCVNDSETFIDCLEDLVRNTASDWIDIKAYDRADLCAPCPSGVVTNGCHSTADCCEKAA